MEKACKDCGHFRRHYILDEQACTPVNCGHCTYPRLKNRKPDTLACTHFVLREQPEQENRHFLTMELVKWLRSLELPPE